MSEIWDARIGPYEILAELGRGDAGMVYKAREPRRGRTVAIKTVRPDLPLRAEQYGAIKRRLAEEAKAASRLNHPNIVAIYDVLEVDETPYIVMEYVEGQTLAQVMAAEAPPPPALAIHIALQVCQALHHAHERHLVHRDLKPTNILLAHGGAVKVSDFGFDRIGEIELTQAGAALGKSTYMSPEQVRQAEVDGRSDLFSLGVVLFELLTGIGPIPGEESSTCSGRILDPALDAVLRRALARDPEQRYPTVRDFAEALRQQTWQEAEGAGAWSAGASHVPEQAQRAALPARRDAVVHERLLGTGRSRARLIGAGCLLIAILAGVVIWRWPSGRQNPISVAAPGEPVVVARAPEPADPGASPGLEAVLLPPAPRALPAGEASGPRAGAQHGKGGTSAERRRESARRLPAGHRRGQASEPSPPRSGVAPASSVPEQAPVTALIHAETAPPPAVWGCLSVNAVPFARVYVDGRYAGETPKGCLRVSPGDRRVVFEADGRRSPERILNVAGHHTTENPLSLSYDFTANRYLDR